MADRLTQLQDCFDMLHKQMYASLHYISTHHASSLISGQPFHDLTGADSQQAQPQSQLADTAAAAEPTPTATTQPAPGEQATTPGPGDLQQEQQDQDAAGPRPDTPAEFEASLQELSRDIVLKEQQIELLISALPGQSRGRDEQEARVKELDALIKEVDLQLVEAGKEAEGLVRTVEGVMWKCKRY